MELNYTDETVAKVHRELTRCGLSADVATGAINHMHNLGILFRERTEIPEHHGVKGMQWGAERLVRSDIPMAAFAEVRQAYEYFERIGVSPDGRWEMIEMLLRDGVPLTEVIGK